MSHSKGDTIQCPECMAELFTLNNDVENGDLIQASDFTPCDQVLHGKMDEPIENGLVDPCWNCNSMSWWDMNKDAGI